MQVRIDTLKPLAEVTEPDERWRHFGSIGRATGEFEPHSLARRHAQLAALNLNAKVPAAIVEHFETAKNLLLYGWFVYRFIPVAELHAYGSVEMALRERAKREGLAIRVDRRGRERPLLLQELIRLAVNSSWLNDTGFRVARVNDEANVRDRGFFRTIGAEVAETADSLDSQRYCKLLVDAMPSLRNTLAHGSTSIHPGGWQTLSVCCDLVDQLFPDQA